jgi:branched-chain amino acid transport system permease protein
MSDDLYWGLVDLANGLLSGATLGGFYAVIAMGLSLNFGVMRLVNLAHGDWLIAAAFLAFAASRLLLVSPFIVIPIVVLTMFAVGYVMQRGLLNRVSAEAVARSDLNAGFGVMAPVLVTFGLSIVISQTLLAIANSDTRSIATPLSYSAIRLTEDLSISTLRLIFFFSAIVILGGLSIWLRTTHYGRAMRAAADDPETVRLMGMKPDQIFAIASGIALAMAGVGGVMIGMLRPFQPFDGPSFLLVAFGVVILGGLGSILGTLAGGILLGIVQVVAGTYFGPSAVQVAGYMLILMVLAFRPRGLFAR